MVWSEITRAKYCRDGLRYASDTTDEEWAMIAPYMPCKNRRGWPRVTEMRALVNSIFFIAQSGCQWRLLPKEFPPYTTVQRGYAGQKLKKALASIGGAALPSRVRDRGHR
jgi:transposase